MQQQQQPQRGWMDRGRGRGFSRGRGRGRGGGVGGTARPWTAERGLKDGLYRLKRTREEPGMAAFAELVTRLCPISLDRPVGLAARAGSIDVDTPSVQDAI